VLALSSAFNSKATTPHVVHPRSAVVRPVRDVLPDFAFVQQGRRSGKNSGKNNNNKDGRRSGERRCQMKADLKVSYRTHFMTATTPAAKARWRPVAVSPPDIHHSFHEVVERFAARVRKSRSLYPDGRRARRVYRPARWCVAGAKSFTVTSGPLLPNDGTHRLRRMTETPCVFVDVQRGGRPPACPRSRASDMMQARWGSHGDYEIIALCPISAGVFRLTIKLSTWRRISRPVMS